MAVIMTYSTEPLLALNEALWFVLFSLLAQLILNLASQLTDLHGQLVGSPWKTGQREFCQAAENIHPLFDTSSAKAKEDNVEGFF